MPFVKRTVSPEYLCRNNPLYGTTSVLEDQNKFVWINFLRQLKSIASHANDIFKDLEKNIDRMSTRTKTIDSRMQNINQEIQSVKFPTVERVTSDGYTHCPLQIIPRLDESSVTSFDMPLSLKEVYNSCTPLPDFTPLDSLRNDGIITADLYSKPKFFYEAWLDMMSSDLEAKRNKRKRERTEKKEDRRIADLPSSKQREIIKKVATDNQVSGRAKKKPSNLSREGVKKVSSIAKQLSIICESDDDNLPPPPDDMIPSIYIKKSPLSSSRDSLPTPPAFMNDSISEETQYLDSSLPPPPSLSDFQSSQESIPPPPNIPEAPFCPYLSPEAVKPPPSSTTTRTLRTVPPPKLPPVEDKRDMLLDAIRSGKSLRKVDPALEVEKKKPVSSAPFGMDVVSVLQQRIQVMAMSDSEDEDLDEGDDWD